MNNTETNFDEQFHEWQSKEITKYAFPGKIMGLIGNTEQEIHVNGLTKREYFAVLAMQSMIRVNGSAYHLNTVQNEVVEASIKMADKLLSQLG